MKRFINPGLSQKRAAAGRAGGNATFSRYGREQMAAWGRLGGRPRLPTLEELENRRGMEKINMKERQRLPANSFKK